MKKVLRVLFAALMVSYGCAAPKAAIDNSAQFNNHVGPYKVFSIGYWQPGYSIITLTDARHDYFVIKAIRNDSLKIGDYYQARL